MTNKSTYIARGKQSYQIVRSQIFDVDNGTQTEVDECVFGSLPYAIDLLDVRAVYQVATDTAGASTASFAVGLTAGGATLVGATNIENSKAVGSTTVGTILISRVAKGANLFVKHLGCAATQPGSYLVQITYRPVP